MIISAVTEQELEIVAGEEGGGCREEEDHASDGDSDHEDASNLCIQVSQDGILGSRLSRSCAVDYACAECMCVYMCVYVVCVHAVCVHVVCVHVCVCVRA